MVAVIMSGDAGIARACAAELEAARPGTAEVRHVGSASELAALDGSVEVLVAVPEHPIPGVAVTEGASAFQVEIEAAVAAVLPGMVERGRGRIVLVAHATGLPGQTWADGSGAAAGATIGLARAAAREVAAAGVTVNVVRTGLVDDERTRSAAAADPAVQQAVEATQRLAPLRSPVSPEDIAAAVGYLVSDDAAYVTGIVLPVDGGLTIGQGAT